MTAGWDDIKHLPQAWCEDADVNSRPCLTCPGCAAYAAERALAATQTPDAVAIYRRLLR